MVIPGQIGYDLDAKAVLLQESFLGSDVEQYRQQLDGKIIEGLTTGVRAKVLPSILLLPLSVDTLHCILSI